MAGEASVSVAQRLAYLEEAHRAFSPRVVRLEQAELPHEQRLAAVEQNSRDHAKGLTAIVDQVGDVARGLDDLSSREIRRQEAERYAKEQFADLRSSMEALGGRMDQRFDKIADTGRWILYTIGGALILAVIGFIVRGGLVP